MMEQASLASISSLVAPVVKPAEPKVAEATPSNTTPVGPSAKTISISEITEVSQGDWEAALAEDDPEKLNQAVEALNQVVNAMSLSFEISYDKERSRYHVKIVDQETKEVIREIPPKSVLRAMNQVQGLLGVDHRR